jgi:hypothetical protein
MVVGLTTAIQSSVLSSGNIHSISVAAAQPLITKILVAGILHPFLCITLKHTIKP